METRVQNFANAVPSKHTPSASQIYPFQEGNYNYKFVILNDSEESREKFRKIVIDNYPAGAGLKPGP